MSAECVLNERTMKLMQESNAHQNESNHDKEHQISKISNRQNTSHPKWIWSVPHTQKQHIQSQEKRIDLKTLWTDSFIKWITAVYSRNVASNEDIKYFIDLLHLIHAHLLIPRFILTVAFSDVLQFSLIMGVCNQNENG